MRVGALVGWLKRVIVTAAAAHAGVASAAIFEDYGTGTRWAQTPSLAGTVIDKSVTDFVFNDVIYQGTSHAIKGSLESLVVREADAGTLDFYWRLSMAPDSYWSASYMNLTGFGDDPQAGWLTEGFGTVGGGHPLSFTQGRFNWGFDGPPGIGPGSSSTYFFVHTDVVSYATEGTFSIGTDMQRIPGAQVQSISAVYPMFSPAPEPESFALAALGLLMVGGAALRRNRRLPT